MIALKSPARPALKLRTLTIARSGQVAWKVTGDHHCGPKALLKPDGTIAVRYSLRLTCAPTTDERGFLLDQAMVDKWMARQASRETDLSCEQLVMRVAEDLLAKIAHDTPHCDVKSLTLSLSPAPFQASIEVSYGS